MYLLYCTHLRFNCANICVCCSHMFDATEKTLWHHSSTVTMGLVSGGSMTVSNQSPENGLVGGCTSLGQYDMKKGHKWTEGAKYS